jgi:hypothetical protein
MQGRFIGSGSSPPNQEKRNHRPANYNPYKRPSIKPFQQNLLRRRECYRGVQRSGETSQGLGHWPLDDAATLYMQGNHTSSATLPEAVSYRSGVSSQGPIEAARTLQPSKTSRTMGLHRPLPSTDMLCARDPPHSSKEVQNGPRSNVAMSKPRTYWLRIKDLPRHIQKILNSVSNLENIAEVWYAIQHYIVKKFSNDSEFRQTLEFENILNCIMSKCMTTEQFFNIVGESCGFPILA